MIRVNWQRLIKELREATGWTQGELANEVGCNQSHISSLSTGDARAGFEIGTELLRLWREHVPGTGPSDLPRGSKR